MQVALLVAHVMSCPAALSAVMVILSSCMTYVHARSARSHACLSNGGPCCCRSHEQGEEQLAQILNEGITTFICLQVAFYSCLRCMTILSLNRHHTGVNGTSGLCMARFCRYEHPPRVPAG